MTVDHATASRPVARYRRALADLEAAQKPGTGVAPYMRHVNRWLGRRAAAAASMVGLTPNAVTGISFLLTIVALVPLLLAPLAPVAVLLVVVLLLASFALDSADGQLARLTQSGGPAGEWLDHVVDAARQPLVHIAILVQLLVYTDIGAPVALGACLVFGFITSVRFFAQILGEQLRRAPAATTKDGPVPAFELRGLIQFPADVATLYLVMLALPWPSTFIALYIALLSANAVLMVATLVRRFRELRDER